ncbi:MAG TPA: right-handed parallel beta-helix repeat-containing protein [Acidimicrobiales bacterium]|nr:right-handed parallel beta-helix repeat-containing protein [Acidimicrobiales bacterium]
MTIGDAVLRRPWLPPAVALSVLGVVTLAAAGVPLLGGPAAPRAGTQGGILLTPGENVQQVVNANPPGTTFVLAPGVFTDFSVQPQAGDAFYGRPGTVLDGGGVTPTAFSAVCANNVTVAGAGPDNPLVIRNYSNFASPLRATIEPLCFSSPDGLASGWFLVDLSISGSFSRGITVGDAMTIRRCTVTGSGILGIGGGGNNSLLQNNTVAQNGLVPPPGAADVGGIKMVGDANTIDRNTATGNGGPGIWTDGDATGDVIQGNTTTDNAGAGIRIEISHRARLVDNAVGNNANYGIVIVDSDNVLVNGNLVAGNGSGIVIGGYARGGVDRHTGLPRSVTGDTVLANRMANTGLAGVLGALPSASAVSFDSNVYLGSAQFIWTGQLVTFTQWQGTGLDVHGVFVPKA